MLGFIGTGNMAGAIIGSVVSSGFMHGDEIAVYDVVSEKTKVLSEKYGVFAAESIQELFEKCDKLVLSVKPNIFPTVLTSLSPLVKSRSVLIISIAAGKSLDFIASYLPEKQRIVRVMPNINALAGEAVSAFCANTYADGSDLEFTKKLCSCFGTAVAIPEEQFSIFSVIGSCSPAFAYMFIDSMARAAVRNGMTKKQALEVSAQAVLGSAKMILDGFGHPYELVDRVCSPGGTTIEGVLSLQQNGFESAVEQAVNASFEKDKRL